jgi:Ca2+-transporting ATPase
MNYYKENVNDILKELNCSLENGLSNEEADKRIQKYGKNQFTPPPKESVFSKIFDNLKEPLIIILMVSGFISILMGHFLDGIGIFAAVLIATSIAVIQEGRSDKAFEKLSQQGENINVKVLRDRAIHYVSKTDITIGDIVHLEVGDKVPADGRIVHSLKVKIDESMLTGESETVNKDSEAINSEKEIPLAERKNTVYSGTLVVEGRATFVVTSVGDNTEMGKIAQELKESLDTQTPLQEKLADLGKKISIVGTIAAGLIFVFEIFNMYMAGKLSLEGIKDAFVISVALIVAAVPEGLPTMVALTLAFNMQKMAKNQALVRKMIACETIGSVNVICSDKTGTLTENKMTAVDVWCNGQETDIANINSKELLESFCINSTAELDKEGSEIKFIGNPTECSLLVCAHKNKVEYETQRDNAEIVAEYHFSSDRKMMSTAIKSENGYRLYTKGSPEKVISLCNKALYNGKIVELSDKIKEEAEEKIKQLQHQAKRVILFAYKDIEKEPDWEEQKDIEKDLVFLGFVGIEDPLRPDVKLAVEKCRMAGINVKILTGDNIYTARAIANQLGIIGSDSLVLEVNEVENMSDDELKSKLDRIVVLARSNPSTKMRIVKLLKEKGDAVVVTGDGINDAPALKSADVGVAMGISGTEVSKEASDIVLLDDSFSTIVKAVRWGRGIYENFQRFIQFQLTVNVVAFGTAFLAEIFKFGMPFTTLQLLWVNIIMDGPPALSLGLEPPRDHLLKKRPIPRNASIVTKDMLFKIVSNGSFIIAALLFQMKTHILGGADVQQSTIIFTAFVLFQLWNAFNCREFGTTSVWLNIHRNKPMISIILLTLIIQFLVVQFGGEVFRTVPLEAQLWLKILGYSFTVILFSELVKLVVWIFNLMNVKEKKN